MKISTRQVGSKYSHSYKVYFTADNKIISPFHDIPLYEGEFVNAICEIPRFEQAKFEISKNESFNPITQDVKKGELRYIHNLFPAHGYMFNYGALPQTWEDPEIDDKNCHAKGDNDPIDIVEIGSETKTVGQVFKAKIIGALGLIDDGEADWKVMVIDSKDKNADYINDINDVEKFYPGLLNNIFSFFRDYKIPTGKKENIFAMEGKFLNAEFAKTIVEAAHQHWKKLIKNGYKNISIDNSTLKDTMSYKLDEPKLEGTAEVDSQVPSQVREYSFIFK